MPSNDEKTDILSIDANNYSIIVTELKQQRGKQQFSICRMN